MTKGIDAVAAAEGSPAPVIDVPPRRAVRRTVDLWRLLVSLAVLVVAVLPAVATRDFVRAAQQGLLSAATALPPALRDALVGTVQAVAMLAPVVALAVWCVRRRVDPVLRVLPAAVLGALGAWSLTHLALVRGRPDAWPEMLEGRDGLVQAGWPSAAYLAACAAAVVAAGPWLGVRPRRALWLLTVGCGVLSVAAAAIVPLDAVAALAVGGAAGSAVLLPAGAPADRPAAQAVADALVASGISVATLRELPADEQHPGRGPSTGPRPPAIPGWRCGCSPPRTTTAICSTGSPGGRCCVTPATRPHSRRSEPPSTNCSCSSSRPAPAPRWTNR